MKSNPNQAPASPRDYNSGAAEGSAGSAAAFPLTRFYTKSEVDPFSTVAWELRTAAITGQDGKDVFSQAAVETPATWSQLAANVVASKYFRGAPGTPQREHSVRTLIQRVVVTLTEWGRQTGYFASEEQAATFGDELRYVLLHQIAAFNSPVWFNVGYEEKPQCSACFINTVSDTMESILNLVKTEGMLFKWGSGSGVNLSTLRSSIETLSGGGTASGPVSFMKGYDAFAGVIKSGGKTRRAAKMVILNINHPDIVEFIRCKQREEQKARALIDAGFSGGVNGEAYASVFFQNANNSVRITDEFMHAVTHDQEWQTRMVTTNELAATYHARDLLSMIAKAAHACGDPGVQFDTTINAWHTCPRTGRINASNPCSEFMFLDNSACNLASINLLKFHNGNGIFDVQAFQHVIRLLILAQEIMIDHAGYPTSQIEEVSKNYRPLGLGYANLGALLMSLGLPYDSDEGRDWAAALTALMTGAAYHASALLASRLGAFAGFRDNREAMLAVIERHRALLPAPGDRGGESVWESARQVWLDVLETGRDRGFRNAQVTLLAPTGTIGFMLDCDTTGVEPDIALVKYKQLVGGGQLKMVNSSVARALTRLGYDEAARLDILDFIERHDTIEGAPHLQPRHLPVFDCAFKPSHGVRSISAIGHVKMVAAVQPFLSGAISKTINMSHEASWEDVYDIYLRSWQLGLKSIAIYRDGSKLTQPVSLSNGEQVKKNGAKPRRRRLPTERQAITHKFEIGGHEGYITVGMYEDKSPGEIFVVMAKEGSTISGLMDVFATAISLALQYGVPLQVLVNKFIHTRFEPSGFTGNNEIPLAASVTDYIFRWLAMRFLLPADWPPGITPNQDETPSPAATIGQHLFQAQTDAPLCSECGALMVRNGVCYKCVNCGSTSGCS